MQQDLHLFLKNPFFLHIAFVALGHPLQLVSEGLHLFNELRLFNLGLIQSLFHLLNHLEILLVIGVASDLHFRFDEVHHCFLVVEAGLPFGKIALEHRFAILSIHRVSYAEIAAGHAALIKTEIIAGDLLLEIASLDFELDLEVGDPLHRQAGRHSFSLLLIRHLEFQLNHLLLAELELLHEIGVFLDQLSLYLG